MGFEIPVEYAFEVSCAGAIQTVSKTEPALPVGAYDADSDIVDYILGITFEIWEHQGAELIHRYYAPDSVVYGLDGVTRGAQGVVDNTRTVLREYPDRLLLGDNVVWCGNRSEGFYSSHRITSPMTNKGPTKYGPATGRRVHITNIADCVVENGVITLEWLVRDNLALVRQLGFDPLTAARVLARVRDSFSNDWLATEIHRVRQSGNGTPVSTPVSPRNDPEGFAQQVLTSLWHSGDRARLDLGYAPYAELYRSPVEFCVGRDYLLDHYAELRAAFAEAKFTLDHVAYQPVGGGGLDIAARWSVAGNHTGQFAGADPTGKPVFILGITHWRVIADRIVKEWTVFDQLGVLSQIVE